MKNNRIESTRVHCTWEGKCYFVQCLFQLCIWVYMNLVIMKNLFFTIGMAPQNLENTVLIHFLNFVSENTEMCLKITWGVSDRLWVYPSFSSIYTIAPPNSYILLIFKKQPWWKQPKCPSKDEWINKNWLLCAVEYYSGLRRSEILIHAAIWMSLEDMLSDLSQILKGQVLSDSTCGSLYRQTHNDKK